MEAVKDVFVVHAHPINYRLPGSGKTARPRVTQTPPGAEIRTVDQQRRNFIGSRRQSER